MQRRQSRALSVVYRLGELFCGPGGIAWGAMKAQLSHGRRAYRIEHVWANDYDSDTCATYVRNICPDHPETVFCQDVRELHIDNLPPIDIFAYGFPCNDFSIVGEKKGIHGTFGPLYTYGVEVINIFKPICFIAENVGGLTSANEGAAFRRILSDLRSAGRGYNLTTHLYKFEQYGVPQTRHRIVIVGIEKSLGRHFRVPKPTTLQNPVTARTALTAPPIPAGVENNERTSQSKRVIERLEYTRPGENAWNACLPAHLMLNVKNTRLSHIYRRLHPDRPSYTITGSGGGGTHGYHWSEPRALTNRERARLQTFPDDFVFHGSKESVRKQIGMAVSPKMAEVIFNAVLKTLAGVDYAWVPPLWNDGPELFDEAEMQGEIHA